MVFGRRAPRGRSYGASGTESPYSLGPSRFLWSRGFPPQKCLVVCCLKIFVNLLGVYKTLSGIFNEPKIV